VECLARSDSHAQKELVDDCSNKLSAGEDYRGGVVTDVAIETEQADLRKKREAVLKATRRGQVATDLPMQK